MVRSKLIFDLDGTLIDSSTGIISALRKTLEKESLVPRCEFDSSLIGPPLRIILSKLSGIEDAQVLNKMIQNFKEAYDNYSYKLTKPYLGINEMLLDLKKNKIAMHIATNKRLLPTNSIINYLGWDNVFNSIYSIDKRKQPYESKTQMLMVLIKKNKIDTESAFYIGDRKEDGFAAMSCGIKFIQVKWGYGDFIGQDLPEVYFQANSPIEISNFINSNGVKNLLA